MLIVFKVKDKDPRITDSVEVSILLTLNTFGTFP